MAGRAKAAPKDDFYTTPAEGPQGRKWEYEDGDVLAGKVIAIFDGDGDFGPYKGYVVEPLSQYTTEAGGDSSAVSADDPLVWYVNDNSAAKRSIPHSGIAVGDDLRVEFEGVKTAAKSGREFKSFNVKVRSAIATA